MVLRGRQARWSIDIHGCELLYIGPSPSHNAFLENPLRPIYLVTKILYRLCVSSVHRENMME